ncbi:MAG: hypothetical protein HZY75_12555 [Nocardioidaceae bacterium]|nr:MAG: hypothetical protein HZY75_12555 [Nocardioidaceae bacterium]
MGVGVVGVGVVGVGSVGVGVGGWGRFGGVKVKVTVLLAALGSRYPGNDTRTVSRSLFNVAG